MKNIPKFMYYNKYVLIVENSTSGLKLNESTTTINPKTGKKEYILSGVFTEFDILNRNERIYKAEKFLPHVNELNERKNVLGIVYGEFDHPDVFDTSLSRISHTIEKIFYVQEKNRVDGEIRLLSTHYGKEAKALVDDNCPIFVSSRAAGVTESNGEVNVKKLFTYDAVADPGFASAKMELKAINESMGFKNNTNFRIYDITEESKINELFNMNNNNDFITKNQMNEYSNYLKEELKKIKGLLIENANGKNEVDINQMTKLAELYDNLQANQTKITKYLDYLSEKVIVAVSNLSLKTDKLVEHSDYLSDNIEQTINFTNYLAEELDKNIDYSQYIAETLDKNIDFNEYIAEHVDKNIKFADYLAESIEKNIDYSQYIAEHLDKNIAYGEYLAENLDNNIAYGDYIAENLEQNIAYAEYLAENVDNNIEYVQYIAEHVDNNIAYTEYVAEGVTDTQAYTNYIAETVDNTIEAIKSTKVFESIEMPSMKDIKDVNKYYEHNIDDDNVNNIENTGAQNIQNAQINNPVQTDAQNVQTDAQNVQPISDEPNPVTEPITDTTNDVIETPTDTQTPTIDTVPTDSIENTPIDNSTEVQIVPGATVSIGNDTGEVLSYNPNNKIVVLQLVDGTEKEVLAENVRIIGDKILETEDSLKNYINTLITETKKRKASEETEPHFLQFLTEKNKKAWYDLSKDDKEKVIVAINESKQEIYSERQLLYAIQDSLTKKQSFEEMILENMPSSLKPIWSNINENMKTSILSQAKLYPNLNTEAKMESFWNSRNLEKYAVKETKKVINESVAYDNAKLSDVYIESFISKFKNLEK